jgi:hypothetical protein
MSIYLDLKYINLISSRLENFKQKNQFLFNFRCPICGDSQTKKNKSRGFFYRIPNKNDMAFKCHNCASSKYFGSFLKDFAPNQYGEYIVERFRNDKPVENLNALQFDFKPSFEPKEEILLDKLLDRLDTLPENNIAVRYVMERKIPREAFKYLYYIDDVSRIEQLSKKYKDKIETTEPRLVIPAFSMNGLLEGVTCRALRGESLRYLTIKIKDDAAMIFGSERIDTTKLVYAVEGPLDSFFLPNAIAVGSTSFDKINNLNIPKENLVIVLDNQPRNKEVCAQYQTYINRGFKICIWPDNLVEKDINEMVLNDIDAKSIIDSNTFDGLKAMLKFSTWRKC